MKIVRVYQESMPAVRLIGKRYTEVDRDASGTYSGYWRQWFREGWFEALQARCASASGVGGDYLGAMRVAGDSGFEYWIGAFLPPTRNRRTALRR